MPKYITYEEPFKGKTFTGKQMQKVYRNLVDKAEYPTFFSWLDDVTRSGVFEIVI